MDRAIDGPPKMGDMAREAVSHVVGLRLEYDKACAELLLGANADDDKRRQDLAKLMLSLAREPGSDPSVCAWRPYDLCSRRPSRA